MVSDQVVKTNYPSILALFTLYLSARMMLLAIFCCVPNSTNIYVFEQYNINPVCACGHSVSTSETGLRLRALGEYF
jgi:hypothetical protein